MKQHTPGPWFANRYDVIYSEGTGNDFIPVCSVKGRDEEAEATARLIAAAPELLESCKYLMVMVRAYGAGAQSEDCVKNAQAAIAKAEGGSNGQNNLG